MAHVYLSGVSEKDGGFQGWRIKEARDNLRMSRSNLAKALKVTRPTIWSWETGTTFPDANYLPGLAAALGRPVEWFFGAPLKEAPIAKS